MGKMDYNPAQQPSTEADMPASIKISNQNTLGEFQRQTPKAFAVALTRTAWDVQRALTEGMASTFDRPTPFTMRAFRVEMAKAGNLEATVWAAPIQARYLFWQIEGGERVSKGFERKMHLFGGEVALPGAGAKLNSYGNMSLSFIKQVAGDKNTNSTAKRFFTGTPKGMPGAPEGVWARVNNNNKVIPVMVFADSAEYHERFEMSAIAGRTVDARFESQLLRAMQQFRN